MGEQLVGDLVLVTNDGREMRFENATVNCIEENVEDRYYDSFNNGSNRVSNMSAELEVTVGNISKKRFVKLLMGKGMQRNEANEMAKYIRRKYGGYNPIQLIMF